MQVTIRRIEEQWLAKAKSEASKRGVSMNEVLREALAIGLGAKSERIKKTNLDKYAGDSHFGPDWENFLQADLKQIDPDLWN